MVWLGQEMSGLLFPLFMRRWKRYFGQWSVWELASVSDYVCNELYSIGEDGFRITKIVSICKLFGRYQNFERIFFFSLDSYSQTHNSKTNILARSIRKQSYFIVYMDTEFPVWFTKPLWVYLSWSKKDINTFYLFTNNLWWTIKFIYVSNIFDILYINYF